jgi:hypothetical protein
MLIVTMTRRSAVDVIMKGRRRRNICGGSRTSRRRR